MMHRCNKTNKGVYYLDTYILVSTQHCYYILSVRGVQASASIKHTFVLALFTVDPTIYDLDS